MSLHASRPVTCSWCGKIVVSESAARAALLRDQPDHRRFHDRCRSTILRLCEDGALAEHERRMTERAAP